MRKPNARSACVALALLAVQPARADVVDTAPNGFEAVEKVHVAASPDQVYAALIQPAQWWSSQHTFSGNAANLTLDARAGGCWCETLPGGGSVQHLVVVFAAPGKMLRARGALGPFQGAGVDGAFTWTLAASGGGTDLTFDASIGGYMKGGFEGIAKAADGVLGEQVQRLKQFVETGSPDKAK